MSFLTQAGDAAKDLSDNAELVAWVCLGLGVVLVLVGVVIGLKYTFSAQSEAKSKLNEAKEATEQAAAAAQVSAQGAVQVRSLLGQTDTTGATDQAVASAQAEAIAQAEANAATAASTAAAAKSAVEQAASIISSLPENVRFPGMLILIGTVLISVATVQFGGTSLF